MFLRSSLRWVQTKAAATRPLPVWKAIEQQVRQRELENIIYHHGNCVNTPKPNTGETPLELAIKHDCNALTIKLLLHAGARVNNRVDREGSSLLHLAAARCSDHKVVKMLMNAGLKPSYRNFHLETPLHVAARENKNPKILETLMLKDNEGELVHALDEHGQNALETCAAGGNSNIANVLIKKGADYALTSYDWSPIYPTSRMKWGYSV